jgi:hypothetical protein
MAGGVDADKDAHEAVLGTALSITLFGGVTFTLRYLMGRVYSGQSQLGVDHCTELSRGYPRVSRVSTGSDG